NKEMTGEVPGPSDTRRRQAIWRGLQEHGTQEQRARAMWLYHQPNESLLSSAIDLSPLPDWAFSEDDPRFRALLVRLLNEKRVSGFAIKDLDALVDDPHPFVRARIL